MPILSITTNVTGQIDNYPRITQLVTTDNLSTITSAGYLTGAIAQGYTFLQTDIVNIVYSYVQSTKTGTYGQFTVTNSSGVITLNEADPFVGILPPMQGGTGIANPNANTITILGGATQIIDDPVNDNLYLGNSAGNLDQGPQGNMIVGALSGNSLTGAGCIGNILLGVGAGFSLTTGALHNILIGGIALQSYTAACQYNHAIGGGVLGELTSGSANLGLCYGSLDVITTGSNNVSVGFESGDIIGVTTLNNSTFLGANCHASANSLTNVIGIGYNVTNGTSNTAIIGQSLTSISTGSIGTQLGLSAVPFSGIALGQTANAGAVKQVVVVTLTATQIQGMYAAPVLLIPAVAGSAICINQFIYNFIYGGTNAFAGGGLTVAQYGNTIHGAGATATGQSSIGAAGLLTGTTNLYEIQTGLNSTFSGSGTASSGIINTGIYLSNQSAPFTSGTNNTVTLTIEYLVVPMS